MLLPPPSEDTRYRDLEKRVADLESALRAAFTVISGGAGLTVKDGGAIRAITADGVTSLYVGGGTPTLPDGSFQPLTIMYRADGSLALAIYDSDPATAGFQQYLAVYDRGGAIVLGDDTLSGQGLARPYVPAAFYRARYADWTASVAGTAFETVFEMHMYKQLPRLFVRCLVSNDTAGATGEVRVMVNGVQLGVTETTSFVQQTKDFIAPIAGVHMDFLIVQIQAKRVAGTGAVRVEPLCGIGIQS